MSEALRVRLAQPSSLVRAAAGREPSAGRSKYSDFTILARLPLLYRNLRPPDAKDMPSQVFGLKWESLIAFLYRTAIWISSTPLSTMTHALERQGDVRRPNV